MITHPFAIPDFTGNAACAETDPEAFFPDQGGSTRAAKRVCARCELRDVCLAWALENGERFGVWGGKSEYERRAMERNRPPQKPIHHGTSGGYITHRRRHQPVPPDDSCGCRAAHRESVDRRRREKAA